MRRPYIAGNWKMNLDRASAISLATEVASQTTGIEGVDVALCPPSVYLDAVGSVISGSQMVMGAQNMYHQPEGAFTGELSAAMLLDVGCRCVILGHSERRHEMGESNEDVNKKVLAALAAGLEPIVCVGELLAEREAGTTGDVIRNQFDGSLAGVTAEQMGQITLAYEPVWAIGTGKVASPEQAEEVHLDLRKLMEDRYNSEVAQAVRIQYGGSVKPGNAAELLAKPNIDGCLIGGASLKADLFVPVIRTAAE